MKQPAWNQILSDKVAAPGGIFSHGSILPVSDTLTYVHTSGVTSRDAAGNVVGVGDIRQQTSQTLKKLQAVLADAGCELCDVYKLLVFVRDIDDFSIIHEVRKEYFTEPYPASTMVQVSRMVDNRSLIEIEAMACRPRQVGDPAVRS